MTSESLKPSDSELSTNRNIGRGLCRQGELPSDMYIFIVLGNRPSSPTGYESVGGGARMYDEDEFDIEKEMAELMDVLEQGRQSREAMADLVRSLADPDFDIDAPLKLDDAVCLPELGGHMTSDADYRSRSATVSVKTLRTAIERSELKHGWLNSKNMFVTRRWIREWLESRWQDRKTVPRPQVQESTLQERAPYPPAAAVHL